MIQCKYKKRNLICIIFCTITPIYIILLYKYFPSIEEDESMSTSPETTQSPEYKNYNDVEEEFPDDSNNKEAHVACEFPRLDPFEPKIAHITSHVHKKIICNITKYPLLFKTDLESNLITLQCPLYYGLESCCYKRMIWSGKGEEDVTWSKDCVKLTNTTTKLPSNHDYVFIYCKNINPTKESKKSTSKVKSTTTTTPKPKPGALKPPPDMQLIDILGVTRLNMEAEKRITKNRPHARHNDLNSFNVVILGLDSIAHMNLIRQMPLTYKYITKDLGGIAMNGYVTVQHSTYLNVMAALTGNNATEVKKNNCPDGGLRFDNCALIWRNFSQQGYRTFYAEDAPGITAFTYNKYGFRKPQTDYYLQPLIRQLCAKMGHHDAEQQICYGPRMSLEILLQYMIDSATLMKGKKYFQFIWANALSHDYLNYAQLGDELVYNTFKTMKERGDLDRTILIFMSDHGMRWGGLRSTFQGAIEVSMPYMIIALPEAFIEKYPIAAQNLKENQDRLSSPFDLYVTLKDILKMDNEISEGKNVDNERVSYLKWFWKPKDQFNTSSISTSTSRGVSFFDKIPSNRTCASAGIPEHYCVCNTKTPIPVNDTEVQKGAKIFVETINKRLKDYPKCANLTLKSISDANNMLNKKIETNTSSVAQIRLTVMTKPGGAQFEVTLIRVYRQGNWTVLSDSRTNMYKKQSHCVNDSNLKNYCFCK